MIPDLVPNVTVLLRDYFDEDWRQVSADPAHAIERFVKAYDLPTAEAAVQEIELLLGLNLSSTEFSRILREDLECTYDPEGDELSIPDWLRWTQHALRQNISTARQRRTPHPGDEVRVLHFPPDHPLGKLERPDPSTAAQDDDVLAWSMPRRPLFMQRDTEFLSRAQGDVLVARSETPILVIFGNGREGDPSPFPQGGWSRFQEQQQIFKEELQRLRAQLLGAQPAPAPAEQASGIPDLSPLARFQPDDLFGLWLGTSKVGDREVMSLAALADLRWLRITQTEVTDAGLAVLERLTALEALVLLNNRLTDAGLAHIRHCTTLRYVDLGSMENEHITDRGLEHLRQCTHLTEVWVNSTLAGDAGLAWVRGLHNLQHINLFRTQTDDHGLEQLAQLPALETLLLAFTRVTDDGMQYLQRLGSLRWLDLSNTAITDKSLVGLRTLTNLRRLNLMATKLSSAGITSLRRTLPTCTILHESRNDE